MGIDGLTAGHHDVALRWRRAVPAEGICGYDDTRPPVAATPIPIGAEERVQQSAQT